MKKIQNIMLAISVFAILVILVNGCKKTADLNQPTETEQQLLNRIRAENKDMPVSIIFPINQRVEFGYEDKDGVVKSKKQIIAEQSNSLSSSSSFSSFCTISESMPYGVLESITRTNFVCGYDAPSTNVTLTYKWRISSAENLIATAPSRGRIKGRNLSTNAFTFTTPNTPPASPGVPIISPSAMTVTNTGVIDYDSGNSPEATWWNVTYSIVIPNSIFSNTHQYLSNPIIATDCSTYPFVTGFQPSAYSFDVNNVYAPVCQRNDKVTCGWGYASQNNPPYIAGVNAIPICYPDGYELPGGHHVKIYEGSTFINEEYISSIGVKNLPYLQVGHTYRFDFNNIKYSNFNPSNLTTGIQCETSIPNSTTVYYFP